MATDSSKVLGVGLLFIAILLAYINIIYVTNFSILDSDPTTYIIVVMLMLFPLIIFSMKEKLRFNMDMANVAIGIGIFIAYLLVLSYLRVGLSFVFGTYRLDAFIFPMFIISCIITIFGFEGLKRLKLLVLFSVFASPLLLVPLLSQNTVFANLNAQFVYEVLRVLGAPVTINGIVISSHSNTSISIASTCAPIGTFMAIVFFLIPVAYLYNGRFSAKAIWVGSGVALMLIFNFVRMFFISTEWVYYGITQAVGTFHLFAGQILFYLTIIVMLLASGKYGLSIKKIPRGELSAIRNGLRSTNLSSYAMPSMVVIAMGIFGMLFTLPYLTAIRSSPTFFYSNLTSAESSASMKIVGYTLSRVDSNSIVLGASNTIGAFAMGDYSGSDFVTYVLASLSPRPIAGVITTPYNSLRSSHSIIIKNGITVSSAIATSGNMTFYVNYFAAPYNISGSYVSMNYEFFTPMNSTVPRSCSSLNYSSAGLFNYIESGIYDTLSGRFAYGNYGILCNAYLTANEI
jgi:exosortase/archaeosortase family protein